MEKGDAVLQGAQALTDVVPTVVGQARPLPQWVSRSHLVSRLNTLISLSPQIPPLRTPGGLAFQSHLCACLWSMFQMTHETSGLSNSRRCGSSADPASGLFSGLA